MRHCNPAAVDRFRDLHSGISVCRDHGLQKLVLVIIEVGCHSEACDLFSTKLLAVRYQEKLSEVNIKGQCTGKEG